MTVDNRTIQNALYDWVASVVPTGTSIVWRNQEVPQPAFPYVDLWIRSLIPVTDQDAREEAFDAGAPAGEEIVTTYTGLRELHLYVYVWSKTNNPENDALYIGESLLNSLQKESVRDTLRAGGLVYMRRVTTRQLDQMEAEAHVAQSYSEVIFQVQASYEESVGYIKSVIVESEDLEPEDVSQRVVLVTEPLTGDFSGVLSNTAAVSLALTLSGTFVE